MSPLEGLGVIAAVAIAIALMMRGPRGWRWIVFALYLPALALPFLIDAEHRFTRAAAGLWVFAMGMRLYELAADPEPRAWWRRMLATSFIYDARFISRARPRLATRRWLGFAVTALLAVPAWIGVGWGVELAATVPALLARWTLLLFAFYVTMVALDWLLSAALAAVGLEVRPTHDHPVLSRSIGELWFRRWNREVGRWLDVRVFRPFARRRHARLGVLAAFAFSALLHVYPTVAGAGWIGGALAGAFFLAHGSVATLERALGTSRWPDWAARTWTLAWVLATWPLFAEPMLAVLYGPDAAVLVPG